MEYLSTYKCTGAMWIAVRRSMCSEVLNSRGALYCDHLSPYSTPMNHRNAVNRFEAADSAHCIMCHSNSLSACVSVCPVNITQNNRTWLFWVWQPGKRFRIILFAAICCSFLVCSKSHNRLSFRAVCDTKDSSNVNRPDDWPQGIPESILLLITRYRLPAEYMAVGCGWRR